MIHHEQNVPHTLWRFIGHFLRPLKGVCAVCVILYLMAGFWGPINSLLIKRLINLLPQVHQGNGAFLVMPVSLIVINFVVLDNITWRVSGYLRAKFIPLIIHRVMDAVMGYILGHSHSFFQDHLSGALAKHMTNLADGMEKILTTVAGNFFRTLSVLVGTFVMAYSVHPIFCGILMIWMILFTSASVLMSRNLVPLSNAQAEADSTVSGECVDMLANQSNVRFFAQKQYESHRLDRYLLDQHHAHRKTHMYTVAMHSVQGGLIAVMMGFAAYFMVKLYGQNRVTVGDFSLIFGLLMQTSHMLWYMMYEMGEYNKAVGRCKKSLDTLMVPYALYDKKGAENLVCAQGAVHFRHVTFGYKGAELLFRDMSVDIAPGEKIGLVGFSGGGKSTFVNLMMRLYDVNDGAIEIDQQDVRDVTQDSLHKKIGVIPQDPVLFQRSIMDNIRYGRLDATDEEVMNAAQKAHAHDFIKALSQGYDTLVGERGIKLSGGQRQRIAMARAILKNAPVLILDEATSQLDSITESLIQDSLWALMKNKTTLVIAHRLSTLLHMDRILVFDKGRIVQSGSHTDLLKETGLYQTLWSAQAGGFLGDSANKDVDRP